MAYTKRKSKISSKRNQNRTTLLAFLAAQEKRKHRRFGTKTQLAGKTLTPMPPAGGELTVELRYESENAHRSSHLFRGVGHVVPTCAALQADHASVQVCATQTPRPPTVQRKKTRAGIKPALALQIERGR